MFAFAVCNTACCVTAESEEIQPVLVLTENAASVNVTDPLQPYSKKAVTFKADYADIEECSTTASEGSIVSETCSDQSDDKAATLRKPGHATLQRRMKWDDVIENCRVPNWDKAKKMGDDVIDKCRVPGWDHAITSAWEETLKAGSFASAWDDAVKSDARSSQISQRKPPELLMVQSPGDRAYNGAYARWHSQNANGMPLWKHLKEEYWIYSCTKGKWCIGGEDVAEDGFKRASGFLYQCISHQGALPDAVEGGWHFWDKSEGRFREDPTIFVKTMY